MSFKSISVAALAAVAAASNSTVPQNSTYVVYETSIETITSCPETVTDCPVRNHNGTAYITHTKTILTTWCPEDEATPAPAPTTAIPATSAAPVETSESCTDVAPVTTGAPAPAPTEDDTTTYVTVQQGVTITVVGHKTSAGVVEVPTGNNTVVEANGAASFGVAGLAAVAAGALLL